MLVFDRLCGPASHFVCTGLHDKYFRPWTTVKITIVYQIYFREQLQLTRFLLNNYNLIVPKFVRSQPASFFIYLKKRTEIYYSNIFERQVDDKIRQGFGQWMNSSIIHDNICSLICERFHPKSYQSDIKYHMTLNIIFSVLIETIVGGVDYYINVGSIIGNT